MKAPVVVLVVLAVASAAFFAGRSIGGGAPVAEGPEGTRVTTLEREVADLSRRLAEERSRRSRAEPERGPAEQRPERARGGEERALPDSAAGGKAGGASPYEVGDAFSFEGLTDLDAFSDRFRAFLDAQLARGPKGYDAILAALVEISKSQQQFEAMFQDEAQASKHLYPWIKALVLREQEMLGLTEHVFAKMADEPQAFAEMPKDDMLEIFTEGIGFIVPGAASPEQMAQLRVHAQKILATSGAEQPRAVQGTRGDIERLLSRFWAEPMSVESATAALRAGGIDGMTLQRALRAVPADVLATLDLTALVLPLIKAGDHRIMRQVGVPPLDRLDAQRIEQAVFEGIEAGTLHGSAAMDVVRRLGRADWASIRPFVERVAQGGERAVAMLPQILWSLQGAMRPDAAWVEDLVARNVLNERNAESLKQLYGIK